MKLKDLQTTISNIPEEYFDKEFIIRIEYTDGDRILNMDYGVSSLKYDPTSDEVLILVPLKEGAKVIEVYEAEKKKQLH